MKKIEKPQKVKRLLRYIYLKLFKIHDSPLKVSLGFGLGVFLGILPGTGPLAALFLAFLFRVNRAAAFLGSLLTNTWLSVVTFILAIKIGSWAMGISWQDAQRNLTLVLKNFHFKDLLNFSIFKIISPLLIRYLVVSFCLGIIAYLVTWITVDAVRK